MAMARRGMRGGLGGIGKHAFSWRLGALFDHEDHWGDVKGSFYVYEGGIDRFAFFTGGCWLSPNEWFSFSQRSKPFCLGAFSTTHKLYEPAKYCFECSKVNHLKHALFCLPKQAAMAAMNVVLMVSVVAGTTSDRGPLYALLRNDGERDSNLCIQVKHGL